jgi:hypothetical protein
MERELRACRLQCEINEQRRLQTQRGNMSVPSWTCQIRRWHWQFINSPLIMTGSAIDVATSARSAVPGSSPTFAGKPSMTLSERWTKWVSPYSPRSSKSGWIIEVLRRRGLRRSRGGGDVSDWLEAGHTKAELEDFCMSAPLWTPQNTPAEAI